MHRLTRFCWLLALVSLPLVSGCGAPERLSIRLQSATVDLAKASHGVLALYKDPSAVCSRITYENFGGIDGLLNNDRTFQFRFENDDAVYLDQLPEGKKITAFLIVYSYNSSKDVKEPMAIACQEGLRLDKGKTTELTFKLNPIPED